MADVFQVLAEPRRREVLALLADDERTAGDIAARFDVTRQASRSTCGSCSRPASIARASRGHAALVPGARPEGLEEVRAYVEAMWPTRSRRLKAAAEREHASGSARCPAQLSRSATSCGSPRRRRWCSRTSPTRRGWSSWMGVAALLDPRPGGTFRVDANGRDVVIGEYVEVEPPHRVVFTWGFEGTEPFVAAGLHARRGHARARRRRHPADAVPPRPARTARATPTPRAGRTTSRASPAPPPAARREPDPWTWACISSSMAHTTEIRE